MPTPFAEFFRAATGGRDPYPFQERFATAPDLSHLVRAPTGAGKTATAVLGWLFRWANRGRFPGTPRRLVYCLPMRVLVEQSEREAKQWIGNLNLNVPVHVLMGGVDRADWHLHPEKPAVLIGTQDMLLSRALNRGYGASRFHWPIDFGLLNSDCLWVFDEPQLMANGVSTSAQLAGLRAALPPAAPCPSVWMSATLEPGWLDTVDFREHFKSPAEPLELRAEDYDPNRPLHTRMTAEKTLEKLAAEALRDGKDVAKAVWEKHEQGTQTLVVLNTVDRAKAVFAELGKLRKKANSPTLLLVHSRFRPHERERLNNDLTNGVAAADRIIVATQVVEAGVDISSRTLVTELAPWASVVQRIGRCNRTGHDGPGRVFWIDLDEKLSPPYDAGDLEFARRHLDQIAKHGGDVSPKALDDYKKANEKPDEPFLPFAHQHVVRRRDVLDLFDTAPDLSGNDIDVSRFVRSDDPDTDVQVFWRPDPPSNKWDATERRRHAARRAELCNVPIGSFKKEFLESGKTAYRWDFLDGEWRKVEKKDAGTVIPGQTFWVTADQGGYDPDTGWSPASGRLPDGLLIPVPTTVPQRRFERPDGFYGSDEWAMQVEWRTVAEHTDEVVTTLLAILGGEAPLRVTDDERAALQVAARWHDWGKVHPVFQSGLRPDIPDPTDPQKRLPRPERWADCPAIAKAPQEFWQKYRRETRPGRRETVRSFRHELASVLGVLRLRDESRLPPDWAALSPAASRLALYLIAAHHGKVRLSIRSMPDDRPIPSSPLPGEPERAFACGVWDRDLLPGADLGGGVTAPKAELVLDPMRLGNNGWTANALSLLSESGPFRLAYLEAILRASDCRASNPGEDDSDE